MLEGRQLLSTFTVTNATDTPVVGKIDLRQAIGLANAAGGDETINFDKTVFSVPQTITLTGTQLELTDTTGTTTITGPKAGLTVSGGGLSGVFQVDKLVTASLSGLTITGGSDGYYGGGGLLNEGSATLVGCTVTGNSAAYGAGILNRYGVLALTNSSITDNKNSGFFGYGGGVANVSGTAILTGCTIAGNSGLAGGGGLFSQQATTTLTDCAITNNTTSYGPGGGVFLDFRSTATLTNCSITGNSSDGDSSFDFVVVGGGLAADNATVSMIGGTVSGNHASAGGGGLSISGGTTNLTDLTISGNSCDNQYSYSIG